MLPVLNSAESRVFDDYLIKTCSLPSLVLMENAARGALRAIEDWLDELDGKAVLIFCGKGNNGGDGLALARLLNEKGVEVFVFIAATAKELSADAAQELKIVKAFLPDDNILHYPLGDTHFLAHIQIGLVVDAVLGTGASGPLKGRSKEAVLDINAIAEHFKVKVLSLDIPTGLNSETGAIETSEDGTPVVVNADRTVAMGSLKQGFFLQNGPDIVGEISVAPLGGAYPAHLSRTTHIIEESDFKDFPPQRKSSTSKFDYGHVLAICGSYGMTGAAIMAASAALRSGCGLLSIATPESQRAIVASAMPEVMTFGLPEDKSGLPLKSSFEKLSPLFEKANVVLCGSGLVSSEEIAQFVKRILENIKMPVILDGGALAGLSKNRKALKERKEITVLTPHVGEFAQMLGMKWQDVQKDTVNLARKYAVENLVILVVKGAPTLIATPKGNIYFNSTGNPGMATAGAGDVLAGILAGMIAQNLDLHNSVLYSVYLHGIAGDLAAKELTEQAITATDIIDYLPDAAAQLQTRDGLPSRP